MYIKSGDMLYRQGVAILKY